MITTGSAANDWPELLDGLEADLRRRDIALQALRDLNQFDEIDSALFVGDVAIPEFIDAPDDATRSRAVKISEALEEQASRIEAALANLETEIQRAARQWAQKRTRTVAQRNLGGFEARA